MSTPTRNDSDIAHVPAQPNLAVWRMIFRIVRWTTYAFALLTIILILRTPPIPQVQVSLQAAARVDQKIGEAQQAASNGQSAILKMDQTELNSFLASHLDIASNKLLAQAIAKASAGAASGDSAAGDASALTALIDQGVSPSSASSADQSASSGPTPEQIDQVRSAVKDVKVELLDDRVRAYVIFDFHGKDMSLTLEGKLGAQDGYIQFVPVSGQIGSLPIPQSTLQAAVQKMMESPENREKLRLPADMSDLHIENGQVVATYK